jgi:hypothetical protein
MLEYGFFQSGQTFPKLLQERKKPSIAVAL